MRKSIFILFASLMLMCAFPQWVMAQAERPYIEMQSRVEREVAPDELYLSIIIKESDYKGKKTLQEMQDAMIAVLKVNRIDVPEALSLDFMGSSVSYKAFSSRVVPRTQATYTLKLSDVAIMQKIIYDLEEKGITNISLVSTKYSNEDALKIELGVEAMKKAQEQARAFAAAVGQNIGKAVSINSWMSQSNPQPRMYKSAVMMERANVSEDAVSSAPEVAVSKLTYTINVTVRFELE